VANEVQVGVRMNRELYDKVIERQQDAKKKTGFEPSVSEVLRQLIERGLESRKR
jgi:hypothetical protein